MSTPPEQRNDVTQFLADLSHGDPGAFNKMLPLLYDELRNLAGRLFQGQSPNQTLQPTALVHEAYLKLVDQSRVDCQDRTHFLNVAAMAMRQILTDHARRRKAAKRGGDWARISLCQVGSGSSRIDVDVIALDDALTELSQLDARRARIAELRFLAGLSVNETAEVLGISPRTVKLGWRTARAWLRQKLGEESVS